MRPVRLPVIVVLVAFATGCHDKNPAGPSQPAVTGLVISGVDAVLTGGFASYTATATSSDGTTRTVMPTWTISDPRLASVDSTGRLDGRAHGSTNLMASYQGRDASKAVQIVNNYAGTWDGRYVIRACTDSGDLTDHDGGWCRSGAGRIGTVGSVRLALAQTGSNLSDITGTLAVNEVGGDVTGMVAADGRLSLGGTFSLLDWEGTLLLATLQIRAWETTLGGPGIMTGRWSQHLTSLYFRIGKADTENELVTMTQVSTAVTPASTPGQVLGLQGVPERR